ncbi:hypothetical protein [Haloarcula salinisoli]|uniref:Uncharacterized protein n=1 Tax=Haloarcula salinisoli TaxID=2487746 RepID=A0A8J7YGM7_9EURY|nr:hypothetical protein [Halomicroarcula salinisoli]MBX0285560.1 hypothetical protein [Halomicroarcula salinisoli]MBX0302956.1 hypothetical protein [Halomicroarcula salinisoli]
MSLIPLDEPRGDGPDAGGDSPTDPSLVDRFLSGVRAVLLALPGVSALTSPQASARSEAAVDTTEDDTSPERDTPAALPGGPVGGQVEVVSTETDDTLTVEAVDNPDATISSDTWEPVER